jgi:hypothetical protein
MNDPLDELLRGHYDRARPADDLRTRLVATPATRRRRWPLALAAAALLAVGVGAWTFLIPHRETPQEMAASILAHHRSGDRFEFFAADTATLARLMTDIDVPLDLPPELAGMTLVGARYCHFCGFLAAHLDLRDAGGAPVTLYITRAQGDLLQLAEVRLDVDGVPVRMWRDGERFLGVAGSVAAL